MVDGCLSLLSRFSRLNPASRITQVSTIHWMVKVYRHTVQANAFQEATVLFKLLVAIVAVYTQRL
jgi:hypothetical protein